MNKTQKKYLHQIYSKPIMFVGLLILMAGIYCYSKMQTNLFPEVLFPRITVIADAGQQPVDRMMITVTKPLESAVKKVPGVTVVKSYTGRGSSDIDVYFKWGTDIYALKTQLESRINEIKGFLPQGTIISTEAMNQSLYPVYGFTLESKNHSKIELRDVGNLIVRPVLSRVNGVSNVVVHGGKAKEFVVIPDPAKMTALGITPSKIKDALNGTNFVLENGNVAAYNRLYLSLTDTRINTIDELSKTVIRNDGIRMVRLCDVARVEVQEQQEFLKINADGNDAVLIDMVKQPGVNLLDFAKDVEVKAKEAQSLLPKGYELKPYYNQSAFVGDSIHSVMRTIYEGLFLALIVMVIFLRTWRACLVVILTIPVTLALSVLFIYLAGITINIMSLGAIAASVGLIIDDAIVIIEQIYREHEENPEIDRFFAVRQAISNLFPAMIASSLSTIVIHFPFRLMSGLAGSFFRELSDTMQITMVASFLVTWLLLPVLHLMIGYKQRLRPRNMDSRQLDDKEIEQNAVNKVAWLTWLYRKPWSAVVFVVILIGAGYFASTQMETGFLPDLDEGTIVLDYHSPSGTDIEETDRLCRQMEKIIMANPNVETYSRRTALGMSFITAPSNYGDYLIQLKKDRKLTTPEVISQLRNKISGKVPVMTIEFGQRISDLLGDLMSTPQPIEVKIFGDDYMTLQGYAAKAEGLMKRVHGVVDIDNGLVAAGSSLVFMPNVDLLSQFGITLKDFQEQLSAYTGGVPLCQNENAVEPLPSQAAMTGGLQLGSVQDGEQMRRILMRFVNYSNNSPEKLMRDNIFLPDGTTRPLSFFCKVKVVPGEIQQRRENLKSVITLTSRIENRDLGSTVNHIQQQFNNNLHLKKGYSVSFGGAYQQQQQSFHELMMILFLAILLVMCVLMFLFREWKISLSVLFISVTGICGSLLALWITRVPLNVSSYTGIIMIVGIIAENAIFTVHQYNMNRKSGGDVVESVNYAIALRIRPKLMTAISSILALMPLALGIGMGAQMQQPLAVAVIGGFCVALPLLLIVLPSMMMIIYKQKQ
jgi:cobalt-zinc-cadmium resistance protein CzcA